MVRMLVLASTTLCAAGAALAHHSYAMFDKRASVVVEGSIAKFQWVNPHSFVWMYVKNPGKPDGYELYTFESDAVNVLRAYGWSRDSLKAGDRMKIRYFPLRDGRPGGYLIWAERSDGSRLMGDRHAIGVEEELQRLEKQKAGAGQ